MEDQGWHRVADLDEIRADPPFFTAEVAGRPVMVLRDGTGALRAVGAACPHLGSPLRSAQVHGTTLECTHHFYAYDLETGENRFPGDTTDLQLPCHEVRVRHGAVWVRPTPLPDQD